VAALAERGPKRGFVLRARPAPAERLLHAQGCFARKAQLDGEDVLHALRWNSLELRARNRIRVKWALDVGVGDTIRQLQNPPRTGATICMNLQVMDPPRDFVGQVAIITGGAGGVGTAVAATLARRGCKLCLIDIS
jgi:NADPH:quinone reductase-like Zn-dependent oxidoreductase